MFQRTQHHLRSHRSVAILPVLILGLLFVGLTTTLAAYDTAQVQKCGQLHTLNGHFSESADSVKQAENCFWHAFQQCNAATLTFEASGIDTGIIHTFTVMNNNGTCSISDATQHYIAPRPPQSGNTYMCAGLVQQADGLHFSGCGDEGTVVVPT
jgi:hypothetical protein